MSPCFLCTRPLSPRRGQHGPQPRAHKECLELLWALARLERALGAAPKYLRPEAWRETRQRLLACANSRPVPGQERDNKGRFVESRAPKETQ